MTAAPRLTHSRPAPARSAGWPTVRGRRLVLLLGVLPVVAGILVVTLGPRGLVVDGCAAVTEVVDRFGAVLGTSVTGEQLQSGANVALFVPLGALLGLATRPRAWPLVLLAGGALSLGAELAQTHLPGRVPDAEDLRNNVAGDCLGLALAVVLVGAVHLVRRLRRLRVPARPR